MAKFSRGWKTMKFRANFWTNYVKFELLFIGTWSTKEFYPAWITGETMHVLWPAWNVISILTTPPLLPPSLLLVRSFRCFNQRGGGGSIIRGTEVGTKGADQRMAEIKTPINCRWAMMGGRESGVQNLYKNDSLSSRFDFRQLQSTIKERIK